MERTEVTFVEKPKVVELRRTHFDVPEGWLTGHTLYSLVSAGTEINACYLNVFHWPRPAGAGYSAVFQLDRDAGGYHKGDVLFTCGNHASVQLCPAGSAVKLPDGLNPQEALFARMAGVSMASLGRVGVPRGETALVMGLGAVGLMAAQAWKCECYSVVCIEKDAKRRESARSLGLEVYADTEEAAAWKGKISLALECTGVQKAAADAADMLREHGEMSLVGVPWKKTDDTDAFRLLNRVFYSFLKVYSGWEMDVPEPVRCRDYASAMKHLYRGDISVSGLYETRSWRDVQRVYDGIYDRSIQKMSVILDWRDCE